MLLVRWLGTTRPLTGRLFAKHNAYMRYKPCQEAVQCQERFGVFSCCNPEICAQHVLARKRQDGLGQCRRIAWLHSYAAPFNYGRKFGMFAGCGNNGSATREHAGQF